MKVVNPKAYTFSESGDRTRDALEKNQKPETENSVFGLIPLVLLVIVIGPSEE